MKMLVLRFLGHNLPSYQNLQDHEQEMLGGVYTFLCKNNSQGKKGEVSQVKRLGKNSTRDINDRYFHLANQIVNSGSGN